MERSATSFTTFSVRTTWSMILWPPSQAIDTEQSRVEGKDTFNFAKFHYWKILVVVQLF